MVLDLTLAITEWRAYGRVKPDIQVIKIVVAANTKLTSGTPVLLHDVLLSAPHPQAAAALRSMMVYVQDAVRQTGFGV